MAYRPLAIGGQIASLGAPEDILAQTIAARQAKDAMEQNAQTRRKGEIDLAKAALDQKELERTTQEAEAGRGVKRNFILNREGAMDMPIGVRSPEFIDNNNRPSNAPFGPMGAPAPKPTTMERQTIIDLAKVNPDMAESFRTGNVTERQGVEDRTRTQAKEDQAQIQTGATFAETKRKNESDAAFNDRQQKEIERHNRNQEYIEKLKIPPPEMAITKGEQAYDRYAAKDLAEWDLGGSTDVDKSIKQLETAAESIYPLNPKTGKREPYYWASGRLIGMAPDILRSERSKNARDQITEVAQRNLRQVLGPQFTEREGTALIRRAYNETLSPEINFVRVNNLTKQIKAAKKAKDSASAYFKQYGTLKGFDRNQLKTGISDFNPEIATFDTDAEADAAGLEPGTKVIVDGREGTWQPEKGGGR